MDMVWWIALVVVLAVVATILWVFLHRQPDAAEASSPRVEPVERPQTRPLTTELATRYADQWRQAQAQFGHEPEHAISDADILVAEVMRARGYPMSERTADVAIEHAGAVEHFRAAHAIAGRVYRNEATAADMRQAMAHYTILFDDLLSARAKQRQHSAA